MEIPNFKGFPNSNMSLIRIGGSGELQIRQHERPATFVAEQNLEIEWMAETIITFSCKSLSTYICFLKPPDQKLNISSSREI